VSEASDQVIRVGWKSAKCIERGHIVSHSPFMICGRRDTSNLNKCFRTQASMLNITKFLIVHLADGNVEGGYGRLRESHLYLRYLVACWIGKDVSMSGE
jgi:hypothetical protein